MQHQITALEKSWDKKSMAILWRWVQVNLKY